MLREANGDFMVAEMPPVPHGSASTPCPKCGNALIDPSGLGWCKSCGFCQSLADDNAGQLLTEEKAAPVGGVAMAGGAIFTLPLWFWASFLCVAIGIFFSIVMDRRLPEGDNLRRATWASMQLAVGYVVVFIAQWFALVTIAPEELSLSFKDAVFPLKLWGLIFVRLPKLKECLWTALLGMGLMVGSVAFIGGFSHWLNYLPKSSLAQEKERTRARDAAGGTAIVVPVD
jgi:hypothetical protein